MPGRVSLSRLCGTLTYQVPRPLRYIVTVSGAGSVAGHGEAWLPRLPLGPHVQRLLLIAAVTMLPATDVFESMDCTGGLTQ